MKKQLLNSKVEVIGEVEIIKRELIKSILLSVLALGLVVGVSFILHPSFITYFLKRG